MILLWLVVFATPVDALQQRSRCQAQTAIQGLVAHCERALGSGFKPKPPVTDVERRYWGWTAQTLAMQSTGEIDTYVLAEQLGEPALSDGWFRFPVSIETGSGRCAVSVRKHGQVAGTLRFEASTGPAVRPHRDGRCVAPHDHQALVQLCDAVWSEDHGKHLELGAFDAPSWSPQDGVTFEDRDWGVRARFDDRSIIPAQLEVCFGPSTGSQTHRIYRDGPPLSRVGRRCEVEARVKDGVVVEIDAWRAPGYGGSPQAAPDLPEPAQVELARIEARCAEGPDRRRASRSGSGWSQAWPDEGRPLRLAHLLKRYGASTLTVKRERTEIMERVTGVHRFRVPGVRCMLETEIADPTQALTRVRIIWPAAAR